MPNKARSRAAKVAKRAATRAERRERHHRALLTARLLGVDGRTVEQFRACTPRNQASLGQVLNEIRKEHRERQATSP